jgi:hypothetical protein
MQGMQAHLQRVKAHIQSIIDRWRVDTSRDVSKTSTDARGIKHILFRQGDLKDFRLDALQLLQRCAIDFD